MPVMEAEVWVHISTPATRKTDDLYCSLAEAYLDFPSQVSGCQGGKLGVEAHSAAPSTAPSALQDALADNVSYSAIDSPWPSTDLAHGTAHVETPSAGTNEDSYGSFPSAPPSLKHPCSFQMSALSSFASSTDGATLLKSRTGQMDHTNARWEQQQLPVSGMLPAGPILGSTSKTTMTKASSLIENTQTAAQMLESQLYDHLSATSDDTSEHEDDAAISPAIPTAVVASPGLIYPTVSFLELSFSEGAGSSHEGLQIQAERTSTALGLSSHEGVSQISCSADIATTDLCLEDVVVDFSQLPTECYPPTPRISVDAPDRLPSQLTRSLLDIKKHNPKRFKPSNVPRKLHLDERGYWLVEPGSWPSKAQYDFWLSLCDRVRKSKLGWGITLHREPGIKGGGLGQVRLYCWAEVIEHSWLYLWLLSAGRVAGCSSRWYDADDTIVVQMP